MKRDKYKYNVALGLPKSDKIPLAKAMAAIGKGGKK